MRNEHVELFFFLGVPFKIAKKLLCSEQRNKLFCLLGDKQGDWPDPGCTFGVNLDFLLYGFFENS